MANSLIKLISSLMGRINSTIFHRNLNSAVKLNERKVNLILGSVSMLSSKPKEFEYISKYFSKSRLPDSYLGIGDDCSAVPWGPENYLIQSTDQMVEGVHFLLDKITPWQLGWKSLAVSLSDIAAMGGSPMGAYLNLALPQELGEDFLAEFSKGFFALADSLDLPLLGGDTTASPGPLFVATTVQGQCREMKRRSDVKPGDLAVVCGCVGDSHIGLSLVLGDISPFEGGQYFLKRHLEPEPLLAQGQWLAGQSAVHGMMDISDGIACDVTHLCHQSGVGVRIDVSKIPLSEPAKGFFKNSSKEIIQTILSGGEDYGLLLSVDGKQWSRLVQDFEGQFSQPLRVVGEFTQSKAISFENNGVLIENPETFKHFKND